MNLSREEKYSLLKIARSSINSIFGLKDQNKFDTDKYPVLLSHSGAFVTLTIKGRLRGCIGYIQSERPLYQTIKEVAVEAALRDPRFPPLEMDELEKIKLEISVLSEPFPMNSYDDIVIGKHGLIFNDLGRRALLLPQVPIEHNMDKEAFLSAICEKAGIYSDYWKEKELQMELFTAIVFSESELEAEDGNN